MIYSRRFCISIVPRVKFIYILKNGKVLTKRSIVGLRWQRSWVVLNGRQVIVAD